MADMARNCREFKKEIEAYKDDDKSNGKN